MADWHMAHFRFLKDRRNSPGLTQKSLFLLASLEDPSLYWPQDQIREGHLTFMLVHTLGPSAASSGNRREEMSEGAVRKPDGLSLAQFQV